MLFKNSRVNYREIDSKRNARNARKSQDKIELKWNLLQSQNHFIPSKSLSATNSLILRKNFVIRSIYRITWRTRTENAFEAFARRWYAANPIANASCVKFLLAMLTLLRCERAVNFIRITNFTKGTLATDYRGFAFTSN